MHDECCADCVLSSKTDDSTFKRILELLVVSTYSYCMFL